VRKADNLPPSCAVVTKSGNLNFLEPSGPVQACNGAALIYVSLMYELKKMEKYLRVNLLGPGPRLMKKRIYPAAVSQRLRNTSLDRTQFRKHCSNYPKLSNMYRLVLVARWHHFLCWAVICFQFFSIILSQTNSAL